MYRSIHHPYGPKWVPVVLRSLLPQILTALQDDATPGTLRFQKTYDRVRTRYFRPGMSSSVARYVVSCVPCQHRKRRTSPPVGPLQPLSCPGAPFETVDIDLYGPVPVTPGGYRWIVTAVDHLTRYAETAPVRTGCASEIAHFFLHAIPLRHGAPLVI